MQVTQSSSGLAFYRQAIKTLWKQVAALSCASIVWLSMLVALEPRLGGVGAQTPVLPLLILVSEFILSRSECLVREGYSRTNTQVVAEKMSIHFPGFQDGGKNPRPAIRKYFISRFPDLALMCSRCTPISRLMSVVTLHTAEPLLLMLRSAWLKRVH